MTREKKPRRRSRREQERTKTKIRRVVGTAPQNQAQLLVAKRSTREREKLTMNVGDYDVTILKFAL